MDDTPRLWTCEACGANLNGAPGLKCPFCGHVHEHGQQPPGAAVEVGTAHAGLADEELAAGGVVDAPPPVPATIPSPPAVEVAHVEPAPEAEPQPEPVAPVVDHVEAPASPPSAPPAAPEPAPAPLEAQPAPPAAPVAPAPPEPPA